MCINGKFAVLLANGCEEIEAIAPIDIMRRAGIDVQTISITDERKVMGAHLIEITADTCYKEVDIHSFSGVILPGGMPGSTHLKESAWVIDFIKTMDHKKGLIAAICAAPLALAQAGVLNGRRFSCYPGVETMITQGEYVLKSIVVDGHLVTGYGPGAALAFGFAITRLIHGDDVTDALQKAMIV